ncbi:MAG TPA: class I SAM-dependent methyltransferase [Candidatus Eisenbacteria bacterium]|nr:class I SAM-dependent methyltransferase [Candidatus Eisenbacteria bacterium]
MDEHLRRAARQAIGFMPEAEGAALHEAGRQGARLGPLLEIGSYCGKSAIYLGAAARACGTVLFSVDHHRGSEEQQPGQEYFDPRLVGLDGRIDTLPAFRRTLAATGLESVVIPIVGDSATVAAHWGTPLGLVFIDGGHSEPAAQADYAGWSPFLRAGGLLVIHDVFSSPAQGGQAPFHVLRRALASGQFHQAAAVGSLRVLEKAGSPAHAGDGVGRQQDGR